MTPQKTVFDWLEDHPVTPPAILTVARSTGSKYQFYLLVRHFRQRLTQKPSFIAYSKAEAGMVKAMIEEYSVFGAGGHFFVLEGFDQRFIDTLRPAPNTWILAETTGGELKSQSYTGNSADCRAILRALLEQMKLKGKFSLRSLTKQDWSAMKGWEDFEPVLRRAMILGQSEDQIGESLTDREFANTLVLTKRGRFEAIMDQIDHLGPTASLSHLVNLLADMLHYRALRLMGHDERKSGDVLGAGWRRKKELEEANSVLTSTDLDQLVDRAIRLDRLMTNNPTLGMPLFYLNSPVSVRK